MILQELPISNTNLRNCFESALELRNFLFLEYLINEKGYSINHDANKYSLKFNALGEIDLELWINKVGGEYNKYDTEIFEKNINRINKEGINKYINEGFIFSDKKLSHFTNISARIGDI